MIFTASYKCICYSVTAHTCMCSDRVAVRSVRTQFQIQRYHPLIWLGDNNSRHLQYRNHNHSCVNDDLCNVRVIWVRSHTSLSSAAILMAMTYCGTGRISSCYIMMVTLRATCGAAPTKPGHSDNRSCNTTTTGHLHHWACNYYQPIGVASLSQFTVKRLFIKSICMWPVIAQYKLRISWYNRATRSLGTSWASKQVLGAWTHIWHQASFI